MLIMYVVERKVRLRQYGRQIMYDFDWSSIVPSMPYLLAGLVITLKITVIAIVVGIVWGTLLAVMRLSSFCRWPGLLNPTSTYSAQSHW